MSTQPRIERITIGRLYNLGRYEHVRYELQVAIPEGADAAQVFKNTVTLLRSLNPRPPVTVEAWEEAKEELAQDPAKMCQHFVDQDARQERIEEIFREARAKVELYEAWSKRCREAQAAFSNLGGTSVFTDCKETWEEQD